MQCKIQRPPGIIQFLGDKASYLKLKAVDSKRKDNIETLKTIYQKTRIKGISNTQMGTHHLILILTYKITISTKLKQQQNERYAIKQVSLTETT
jgi:hypothetical protein